MSHDFPSDSQLLAAARRGDPAAWAAFVRRWADLLYGCCHQALGEEEAAAEFPRLVATLGAEQARALAGWDGRGRLAEFLTLKAADLLAAGLARRLESDRRRGWAAFERFFGADLDRMARRRAALAGLPPDEARDLAQELRLRLMAGDGAALRRHDGRGSFTGFVRRAAHNLLEDILRSRFGRAREPEPLARLDDAARQAWRLVHRQGHAARHLPQLLRGADGCLLSPAEAEAALARAEKAAGHGQSAGPPRQVPLLLEGADGSWRERPLPSQAPSPEEALAETRHRAALEAALETLSAAMARLPDDARAYLELRFLADPPLPPRLIAQRLGVAVEELYRRRKLWESQLRTELAAEGVEEFPLPSV